MLSPANKANTILWLAFYILWMLCLGGVIILCITSPQNHLFPWQMAIGVTLGTLCLLAAFFLWEKVPLAIKRSLWLYVALLLLYGAFLYMMSCAGRSSVAFWDYTIIWNAALEVSQGCALSYESYFLHYSNNIIPMLYLSVFSHG